jgi:hypothetical protein
MIWSKEAKDALYKDRKRDVWAPDAIPFGGGTTPKVILQGKALKIINRGGGRKCKTINLGGGRRQTQFGPKTKGTDYIVFNCPGCDMRNKASAYRIMGSAGQSVSVKCNKCYREIELAPPRSTSIIIDPRSPARSPMDLLGPDGRPL